MARAPFNVLAYPYFPVGDREFEYALLKRRDAGFWQGVSGGGEADETPLAAARRETFEETGLPPDAAFLELDTVEPIPVIEFGGSERWGEAVFVIKQYCFGMLAVRRELRRSWEHIEYQWLSYADAYHRLKYDGNRTALWELNQRLKGRGPRG